METKLFKELTVGQIFRRRGSKSELIKIEPIYRSNGKSILYNARYALPDGRNTSVGHGTKCEIPPYEQGPKEPTTWAKLSTLAQAAGWKNLSELHEAMLAGVVEVPKKPE